MREGEGGVRRGRERGRVERRVLRGEPFAEKDAEHDRDEGDSVFETGTIVNRLRVLVDKQEAERGYEKRT